MAKKRLIDANAFWESVSTDYWEHFTQYHTTDQIDLMEMVEENLSEQPTVDAVEVVHGRWILADDGDGDVCSACGTDFCNIIYETGNWNYCPNCGAKMDAK